MVDFFMNNMLGSAIAVGFSGFLLKYLWKWWKERQDSKKIYNFLVQSKKTTVYTFRTTHAIASSTKLTEDRVEEICSKHPDIRRNQKEKRSWTLTNSETRTEESSPNEKKE